MTNFFQTTRNIIVGAFAAFGDFENRRNMATNYNPRRPKEEKNIVINTVDVRPIVRQSQDIQKWRNALITAEGYSQQRAQLYDLYADVLLDGFLKRLLAKRIESITNCNLTFTIDGEGQDDIIDLTRNSFFQTAISEALNSKFYGHSLLELNWGAPRSNKGATVLIPRKHVKPRFKIVTKDHWSIEGLDYMKYKHVIEIGTAEDLGDLLEAAQYVIYKRGAFGDWAEYAEVFGMPFRWATYNNEQSRVVLETALAQAGSAGYVVAPQDAQLQFLSGSTAQSNDVFKALREACNEELSITILGNSMTTTEAKSSGYAQSKTHADGQMELHKADRKFILQFLTEKITPYLASIGYKVADGHWDFVENETLTLAERVSIDMQLAQKIDIGDEYWYEKYKIPMPKNPRTPEERAAANNPSNPNATDEVKKKAIT